MTIVILFGVTGSGKTTIGTLLAAELGWQFYDADRFHSADNIEKMRQGIPLTDADRQLWLGKLNQWVRSTLARSENAILACSALKAKYRQLLKVNEAVQFVYLKGSFSLIETRLQNRQDHFMNPQLLPSQFETLEEDERGAIVVDIASSPEAIVRSLSRQFKVYKSSPKSGG